MVRNALVWFVCVLVGVTVGSLILGAFEGNSFHTNLVFGIKVGVVAAVVVAAFIAVRDSLKARRRPTP